MTTSTTTPAYTAAVEAALSLAEVAAGGTRPTSLAAAAGAFAALATTPADDGSEPASQEHLRLWAAAQSAAAALEWAEGLRHPGVTWPVARDLTLAATELAPGPLRNAALAFATTFGQLAIDSCEKRDADRQ